jgi:glycosyltransferase involved in cell wall biosynthesis
MISFSRRKKLPRFSVVVPTYNRSRFIVPTLESALGQTQAPFEIIVVADGCTDDSEQVARRTFSRAIRWISLPEHSGSQSAPNNCGIQTATGTHIAYLGHDDIWSPHHLELLAAVFENSSPDSLSAVASIMGLLAQDIINSPVFSRILRLPLANSFRRHQ